MPRSGWWPRCRRGAWIPASRPPWRRVLPGTGGPESRRPGPVRLLLRALQLLRARQRPLPMARDPAGVVRAAIPPLRQFRRALGEHVGHELDFGVALEVTAVVLQGAPRPRVAGCPRCAAEPA